ncbi:uncharacterized protein PADG_05274 [Paracoccidioides brasiliensis Pb18]|uniref:Uncharacterized protein n=1 Tax=Paracoccidioides brasiliensis (strain Pb18) TaxID=502780 RepID=C1GDD8_PARBD|nr:uncharacterized protein PADG_05274 [Paracoccidioides brasiliensis Pb18]EEH49195.2 hypothetical protein PADG_05274 [Paracoccidioides brasiliensis Pb18]
MQALPDKLLHITGRRVREVGPGRGVSRAWLALFSCITRVASSRVQRSSTTADIRQPTATWPAGKIFWKRNLGMVRSLVDSQGIHESTSTATAAPPQFVPGSASSQLPQGREKERKDCHTPDIVVIDAHRRLDFNVIFNFTLESSHHH